MEEYSISHFLEADPIFTVKSCDLEVVKASHNASDVIASYRTDRIVFKYAKVHISWEINVTALNEWYQGHIEKLCPVLFTGFLEE